MGWRHLIIAALLLAPLASPAQDWRAVRDQRQQSADESDEPDRVHIYKDKPRSYVGLNLGHVMLDQKTLSGANSGTNLDEDVTLTVLNARLGAMTSDHFGMEARFGVGVDNHTLRGRNSLGNKKWDQSIDYAGGLYLTGRGGFLSLPYDLGRIYAQGYVGYATGQLKTVVRNCGLSACTEDTERSDESDFSYGVALGIQPTPEVSLALEYMSYIDEDKFEATTVEAGIMYHF